MGVLPQAAVRVSDCSRLCDGEKSQPDHHLRRLQQSRSVPHTAAADRGGQRRGQQVDERRFVQARCEQDKELPRFIEPRVGGRTQRRQ